MEQEQVEIKESDEQALPFWRVGLSVIQAVFGVQNSNNRERDFRQGSFLPFVIAAVLFTTLFVVALLLIVKLVVNSG